MKNSIIGTAFYINEKKAVNVNSKKNKLKIYFQCICVFFESVRRFHKNDRLELFINVLPDDEFLKILNSYNVTITLIDSNNKYVNNTKIENDFPGCLFSLDVIRHISLNKKMYENYESLFLMDNDVLIAKNLHKELSNIKDNTLLAYKIGYDFQSIVNGKSRSTLSYINTFFNQTSKVDWYGGEVLGISIKFCEEFIKLTDQYFDFIENDAVLLKSKITEEHIYSLILSSDKVKVIELNDLVKRVWTTVNYNNIESSDSKLIKVFHYPSEKEKLFNKLFRNIKTKKIINDKEYIKLIKSPLERSRLVNLLLTFKIKFL